MSAARWRITARPSLGAGPLDTAPIADTMQRTRNSPTTLPQPTAAGKSISSGSAAKGTVGKAVPLGVAEPTSRRDGYLYVPATYDSSRPSPLVVMLHGVSCGLRRGGRHLLK